MLMSSKNDLSSIPSSGTNSSTLVIGSAVDTDAKLCLLRSGRGEHKEKHLNDRDMAFRSVYS
jgi:hypothetical protein